MITQNHLSLFDTAGLSKAFELTGFDSATRQKAQSIESCRKTCTQIAPFSASQSDKYADLEDAYRTSAAICGMRIKDGEQPVGRKIGFTNKNIWPRYNIDASIWNYMYNSSTQHIQVESIIDLRCVSKLEPRIEPEIVLHIAKQPSASMSDEELLSCIDWIAHGFEIVQSIYPGWKFTAADTTGAYALHGRLLIGPTVNVSQMGPLGETLIRLQTFEIDLLQNGKLIDSGTGSNVLGSPIKAFRHLLELLEAQSLHPQVMCGEIITTGTLTNALLMSDQDTWKTQIRGISLPDLNVKFKIS